MNEELRSALERFLDQDLKGIVLSNSRDKERMLKVQVRPVALKGKLAFQAEEFVGKQAFHRNLGREEAMEYIDGLLNTQFRQMELWSAKGEARVLVSKKGAMSVKTKERKTEHGKQNPGAIPRIAVPSQEEALARLSHNRKKRYVLEEGTPVPFLVDLGVMNGEGKVVRARYDKFRQINRFLEFIEDVLPALDKGRENLILDFGCGKSYLTFAMYYYLKVKMGYQIRIIGLDLKKEVIDRCNALARQYGYDTLTFLCGDIADYEGVDRVDMVVTLHACDTATDYALAKAVGWKAKVILSVPCCQHEWNGQMKNELMAPVLGYGLIKERMAALYTDAIRAQVLERMGYRTQILEFIDMEHTPKNLLIRAVYQGTRKDNEKEIREILDFFQVTPTIVRELMGE